MCCDYVLGPVLSATTTPRRDTHSAAPSPCPCPWRRRAQCRWRRCQTSPQSEGCRAVQGEFPPGESSQSHDCITSVLHVKQYYLRSNHYHHITFLHKYFLVVIQVLLRHDGCAKIVVYERISSLPAETARGLCCPWPSLSLPGRRQSPPRSARRQLSRRSAVEEPTRAQVM